MNGYEKPCRLDIHVRADMLESVYGFGEDRFPRELAFGLSAVSDHDPASMRWAMTLLQRQIEEVEGKPWGYDPS